MLDACNNKRASCVPQIPIIKSICVMAFLGPMSFGVCLLLFDPYSQWYDSACAPCTFHSNKITSTKWNSHQVHLLSTQLLQLLGGSYPHRLMAYFLPLLFIFFVYLSHSHSPLSLVFQQTLIKLPLQPTLYLKHFIKVSMWIFHLDCQ